MVFRSMMSATMFIIKPVKITRVEAITLTHFTLASLYLEVSIFV